MPGEVSLSRSHMHVRIDVSRFDLITDADVQIYEETSADHGGTLYLIDLRPSPGMWCVLLNAGQPTLGVTAAPTSCFLPCDAQPRRNLLVFQPVGRQEHDRRTFGQSDRNPASSLELLQVTTFGFIQVNSHCFSHELPYARQRHMFH